MPTPPEEDELKALKDTTKRIGFLLTKMGPSDEMPFDPRIEILLDWYTTSHGGDAPLLSPELMTDREIDEHVKALKANLDAVAVEAKAALALAKAETGAITRG